MSQFKIINDTKEINLSNEWVNVTSFKRKDKIVDSTGKTVTAQYRGNCYRVISKREREYTSLERTGRGFIGVLLTICTLSLALFLSKSVQNLFIKQKVSIHYCIPEKSAHVNQPTDVPSNAKELNTPVSNEAPEISESEIQLWYKRICTNDCTFSDEEFIALNPKFKEELYFKANYHFHENFVKRLQSLGMDEAPVFKNGPSSFAYNMDILKTKAEMQKFLKVLKKDGCLLKESEFKKLDPKRFFSKRNQIGRIQGKFFIEKLAKENNLKHIKVPRKIIVIKENDQTISLSLGGNLKLHPKEGQVSVYAERIEAVDRKLSLEEAVEFMTIVEKSGYNDFFGHNFIIAKDGIYFIDTEFENFRPSKPSFDYIDSLKNLVNKKDLRKFLAAYNKLLESYTNEQSNKTVKKETEYNHYKEHVMGYSDREFLFKLDSLNS